MPVLLPFHRNGAALAGERYNMDFMPSGKRAEGATPLSSRVLNKRPAECRSQLTPGLASRRLRAADAVLGCRGRRVGSQIAFLVGSAIVAFVVALVPSSYASATPGYPVDRGPAERALQALRRAWLDELDELTNITRTLAVSDETYDFVARPNLPYVNEHYDRRRLATDRIDTVLIIDRHRKPLFWRRVGDAGNRGFPDAEAFLAQLPPLTPDRAIHARPLVGAVRLTHGPSLVVALPIYPSTGSGQPRGWLITARALDAAQWRHYEEQAHVPVDVLDPVAASSDVDVAVAQSTPLKPVVRVEVAGIRGLLSVPDLAGKSLRVFSVLLAKPIDVTTPIAPAASGRARLWVTLATGIASLAGAAWWVLRRRGRATAREFDPVPSAPAALPEAASLLKSPACIPALAPRTEAVDRATVPADPIKAEETKLEATYDCEAIDAPIVPAVAGKGAAPEFEPPRPVDAMPDVGPDRSEAAPASALGTTAPAPDELRARMTASGAALRYQPQVNPQTGRVAGVAALLCVRDSTAYRPATELVAELERIGRGNEFAERWLHEACSTRRFWLRQADFDYPVSVPLSKRTVEDPAFPSLVRKILADVDLPPRFLELEVPEAALGMAAARLRALAELHDAGIFIAIDGFKPSTSNLSALTLVPIAKLRVDPRLVPEVGLTRPAGQREGLISEAQVLGITVCATGVDSPDLAALAARSGFSLAQGPAFGPLVDRDQFLVLVRERSLQAATKARLQFNLAGGAGASSSG